MRVQARRCDFVSYMLPARRCTCQAATAPSTVARVSVAAYFKFIVQSPSAHGPCIAMGIERLFLYVGSCGAARCGSRRSREERTAYAAVKLPSAASNARVQYCHLSHCVCTGTATESRQCCKGAPKFAKQIGSSGLQRGGEHHLE